MSNIKDNPINSNKNTKNVFDSIELNQEAISNLAGYFDVLIQMDLDKHQCNERSNNAVSIHNNSNNPKESYRSDDDAMVMGK